MLVMLALVLFVGVAQTISKPRDSALTRAMVADIPPGDATGRGMTGRWRLTGWMVPELPILMPATKLTVLLDANQDHGWLVFVETATGLTIQGGIHQNGQFVVGGADGNSKREMLVMIEGRLEGDMAGCVVRLRRVTHSGNGPCDVRLQAGAVLMRMR